MSGCGQRGLLFFRVGVSSELGRLGRGPGTRHAAFFLFPAVLCPWERKCRLSYGVEARRGDGPCFVGGLRSSYPKLWGGERHSRVSVACSRL